jgi:hypothetical protein
MEYQLNARRLGLITASLLVIFVNGCEVTLNPVKRKPLEISPLQTALVPSSQLLHVAFASTLPGIPLAVTVWDNHVGAFADAKESARIGFTQDYTEPLLHGESAMFKPSYTHLFVPFGRIFEGVFDSGMQKVFPQAPAAIEATNETVNTAPPEKATMVRLKVVDFQVWEQPLNHINMKASVECRWSLADATNQTDSAYVAQYALMNQSLGTLPTSGSMVKKLEAFANSMAATLSENILNHLQQQLGH